MARQARDVEGSRMRTWVRNIAWKTAQFRSDRTVADAESIKDQATIARTEIAAANYTNLDARMIAIQTAANKIIADAKGITPIPGPSEPPELALQPALAAAASQS